MSTEAELTPVSAALSAAPAPGSLFADRYEVGRILGQGGMSIVFAATHLPSEYPVAIKLLLSNLSGMPDATQRLAREARVTARVKHPNIVEIYDVGETDDGKVFLVMEYLRGKPLSQWVRGDEKAPVNEVLHTLIQAMEGIALAHSAGVIHRDLKPDNIFVCCDENGNQVGAKVLDFGVSKLIDHVPDVSDASITQTGMMVGTPYYMAPEQIRDSRGVDHRADIYALGVIVYEMFTGAIPFRSTNFGDLLIEIMQRGIPSLREERPDLPPALVRAVDRAVSLEPADRFPDVKAFIEALEPFSSLSGLTVQDSRVSAIPTATATRSGIGPVPDWQGVPSDFSIVPAAGAPAPRPSPLPPAPTRHEDGPAPLSDSMDSMVLHPARRRKLGKVVVASTLLFGCAVGIAAAIRSNAEDTDSAEVITTLPTPQRPASNLLEKPNSTKADLPRARTPVQVSSSLIAKASADPSSTDEIPAKPKGAAEKPAEPPKPRAATLTKPPAPAAESPSYSMAQQVRQAAKQTGVLAKPTPAPRRPAPPPPAPRAAKRRPPAASSPPPPAVGRTGASISADDF